MPSALEAINLHFHDLRREAASRWLEGGMSLIKVKAWLGHRNISQTSTYLADAIEECDDRALQRSATPSGNHSTETAPMVLDPNSGTRNSAEKPALH